MVVSILAYFRAIGAIKESIERGQNGNIRIFRYFRGRVGQELSL